MAQHRGSLAIGFALMVVSRAAGSCCRQLEVPHRFRAGQHRADWLWRSPSRWPAPPWCSRHVFGLSQVVSLAGHARDHQHAAEVQNHVLRLPVSYFDSTKTGILIARVMNDAEGVRTPSGTGIIQLVGGLLTAAVALVWLFAINWRSRPPRCWCSSRSAE